MRKVDTKSWKEFRLDAIFNMTNTKSIVQKDIKPDSGDIPYVTAQAGNNGVLTYIDCPKEWTDKGNCIMIGGKTLTFSYQEKDFCSNDSHNIALYLKSSNQATKLCYLFLISALRAALYQRYSWGDSVSMKRIKDESFYLPVDHYGNPNYEFMDKYMQKILSESKASLNNLKLDKHSRLSINIKEWKKFHLYDDKLFNIDMGTKLDKIKMSQSNPTINFVGRANSNNGITSRVDLIKDIPPYKAGYMSLSLGGEYLGSCFIQPEDFYTSQNVIVLIPKWNMPFFVKQFIATMIFRESRTYYKAFVDELNRHIKTDFSFYLPVTKDNNPDWEFMYKFMEKTVQKSSSNFISLSQIVA